MVRSRGDEAPTVTPARLVLSELTDEQRRGGACAHCRMPVSTGSAVDLGERRDADGVRIFPRAHPGCLPASAS